MLGCICVASAVQAKAGPGQHSQPSAFILESVLSLLSGFDAHLRCVLKTIFIVKRELDTKGGSLGFE